MRIITTSYMSGKCFKCKKFKDYHELYLKVDTLLLADIFENFRNTCMNTYQLDPVHYFTAPGLSFDSLLKYTKIKIRLYQRCRYSTVYRERHSWWNINHRP